MKILMNHFCIFSDNLRKFLLVEAGSVVIRNLLCVVMLLSDHTFFPVSFFFFSLSFLASPFFLSSLPLPHSLLSLYARVTANLQFRWSCICLYLANFKPGLKNGRHAAEYVLFLQCHTLIPSNLFTDINANWENN